MKCKKDERTKERMNKMRDANSWLADWLFWLVDIWSVRLRECVYGRKVATHKDGWTHIYIVDSEICMLYVGIRR